MSLDDEVVNMLATCERLKAKLDGREKSALTRLKAKSIITPTEDAEIRALWDKVTNNGTVDT